MTGKEGEMRAISIKRTVSAAAVICALALVLVSAAIAAEVSRDEYKDGVEPICKTNTQANERIFAGVKAEVRQGKLKKPAASFTKASGC
jgi:hypothetical protein